MKIAVIAANGRSGKVFVNAALAAGHTIRAGVRGSHDFAEQPNLTIVACDATNEAEVAQLLEGCEAVVSFIGHVKGSPAHVQTDAITTVLKAMATQGIKRIVSLTGTGVRFDGDHIPLYDRFLNFGVGIVDPQRIKDGIDHVEALKNSDVDWTILRVLKLQNVKPTPFVLKAHGPTKLFVSREDVAKAALQVLEERGFIREAPILSR